MGILNKHQKTDIRFERGDLKIFEPTDIIKDEVYELLKNQNIKVENDEVSGEVDLSVVRLILRESTSIGNEIDEYDDNQLDLLFENGDRDLTLFIREIEKLINELVEDLLYAQEKEFELINKILNILNSNSDKAAIENKFNKLMKKQGLNVTINDMIENANNPDKLNEIIKSSKRNYNKSKK